MRFLLAAFVLFPASAYADCMAKVLAPTAALESPTSIMQPGTFGPITQIQIDKKTGAASLCAHGDYCYPTRNLRLDPGCQWIKVPYYDAGDYWILFVR